MNLPKRITVGSESEHKIKAVRQAVVQLGLDMDVAGCKAASGQNTQPVGYIETYSGAFARANAARHADPESLAIGVESGIHSVFGKTYDFAAIVILTPDGREIKETSGTIEFPKEYVDIARQRGFETTTVGSVIAEKLGGDPTDPHAILTGGKITRASTLVEAVAAALKQI